MSQGSTWKMLQLMNEGGPVMWALLVFSIIALATAMERAVVLRRALRDSESFTRRLRSTLVRKRSVADAAEASRQSDGPVARVAEVALRRFDRPPNHLEQVMERQARREQRTLSRGMGILATIATTAPLLGFLGTVTGMMASFDVLALEGIRNPGLVALGIKEALTTTAGGLVVAVPTQIAYNMLAGRVERLTADIESTGNLLLEVREEMA
ncbi:MAG: MotA/TolQ/ExbB proton channel family protein [Acidobacteriota bacterium]